VCLRGCKPLLLYSYHTYIQFQVPNRHAAGSFLFTQGVRGRAILRTSPQRPEGLIRSSHRALVGGIIPTVERVADLLVLGGSERRRRVHVGVIHHISDPERIEAAEERVLDSRGRSIIDPARQPCSAPRAQVSKRK
jgi:hypothetical protein